MLTVSFLRKSDGEKFARTTTAEIRRRRSGRVRSERKREVEVIE